MVSIRGVSQMIAKRKRDLLSKRGREKKEGKREYRQRETVEKGLVSLRTQERMDEKQDKEVTSAMGSFLSE